jgi:hypothetical protein
MATMMPQQPAMTEEPEETMTGGYQICINVGPAGKITVGVETAKYEAAEEEGAQAAGMERESMQPVGDFQEAIKTAMDIYKANGKMAEGQAEEAKGFAEAFSV